MCLGRGWGITFVNHFNDASPLHKGEAGRPNKQCVIRAGEWETGDGARVGAKENHLVKDRNRRPLNNNGYGSHYMVPLFRNET